MKKFIKLIPLVLILTLAPLVITACGTPAPVTYEFLSLRIHTDTKVKYNAGEQLDLHHIYLDYYYLRNDDNGRWKFKYNVGENPSKFNIEITGYSSAAPGNVLITVTLTDPAGEYTGTVSTLFYITII